VPVYPRISNHTDFDPLRLHPQVDLQFVGPNEEIPAADLIILPGSKSVRADLHWLKESGWSAAINKHLRYGGKVFGICGGFQMLGRTLHDPEGIEGEAGHSSGLALLDMETHLTPQKQLRNVSGTLCLEKGIIEGYEIHAGISQGPALSKPFCKLHHGDDGAISDDGNIIGSYVHGVFEQALTCDVILKWAGLNNAESPDYHALREHDIDRLADMIENHMDIENLKQLLALPSQAAKEQQ
jgi:adenosylcobyric acid synthase